LPALKSNNLAFEIFKYYKQSYALTILRSLNRKALEKSKFLHNYTEPLIFKAKALENNLIFEFKIGVLIEKK